MRSLTVLGFSMLLLCGLVSACSLGPAFPTPQNTPIPSRPPSVRTTPVPFPVPSTPPTPQPWGTFGPSFIKDGVTFEASAYSRDSCVSVTVGVSGPLATLGSLQYQGVGLVRNITLIDGDRGLLLRVQLTGRGGGGGGGDGTIGRGQEFIYEVSSPLPVRHLMALVTFDQAFRLSAPMRFDLQVIPRDTLQCPQLPLTTPEG